MPSEIEMPSIRRISPILFTAVRLWLDAIRAHVLAFEALPLPSFAFLGILCAHRQLSGECVDAAATVGAVARRCRRDGLITPRASFHSNGLGETGADGNIGCTVPLPRVNPMLWYTCERIKVAHMKR